MSAPLRPRKSPVQARSVATVAALHTATIQILAREGLARCTTTRVAGRAGIAVGSLYQYYPNRDALLAAVLEQHLDGVASAVEAAAQAARGKGVAQMAADLVAAVVAAKLDNPQVSQALYRIAGERGGAAIAARIHQRMAVAVCQMLESAADAHFSAPAVTAEIALGAIAGPIRAQLEGQLPPAAGRALVAQLTLLLQGYFCHGQTQAGGGVSPEK
ncbi:TetR/AcrR family transcriptional regulator [Shimwellia pseudoproteus]|uniref:TetR/AcrR family transcriptional regulator n=1 Tax=Shimwellia pseudoproteus TaxID=570012 RepID=UPI0018EBFDB4|nr:TetR/AcrR family transcriptional regulator [Shimwellia pseudoproteus]MBJ3815996.1 TetR/AcrR family transcriptional regulator [Shimwellia pseudoproteus]